ncbi:MAG: DUF2975 domain-containing protein [Bacteroidota bacterium]|nr:DUF2975 domain-containing protein [Bacteroidota bacterium]
MENVKKPLSIKIIYWVTEVIFWLMTTVSAFMIIGCLIVIMGFKPPDLNLHVKAPFTFNLDGQGSIDTYKGDIPIKLVEQSGQLHFVDTQLFIARPVAGSIIVIMIIAFNLFWMLRNLMRNVYRGKYFDMKNIKYIKYIAYWILGLWLAMKIYFWIFYKLIEDHVCFDGITIQGQVQTHNYILLIALSIWTLSHIFKKGLDLEETQKLTV